MLAASSAALSPRKVAFLIALSDWMTRVWTMQEALLSSYLMFMFEDTYVRGVDLIVSLIDHAAELPLHWQQYEAIWQMCGMLDLPHTSILERIHSLAKKRLTTKREDLARSLYPLFGMKWPGASFMLEEAQQALLKHLGDDAPLCHPLHGPIMPRSWSWASLIIVGCSGGLAGPGMLVTSHDLREE